jgi:hypothetical protein
MALALIARLQGRTADEVAALEKAIDVDLGFGPPAELLERLAEAKLRAARQDALRVGSGLRRR